MLGAVLCFFIARYFGRPVVVKLTSESALATSDRFFEPYGKHAVLIARLVPVISFDVISYASGLTGMSFSWVLDRYRYWTTTCNNFIFLSR